MIGASDDDLAQFSLVERVERGAAARLPVTDFKPAVGQDPLAQSRLFDAVAAMRVALASGQKDGAGGDDLRPPAVIGVALVVDVGGTGLQRDGAAGHDITSSTLAEVTSNHTVRPCRGSCSTCSFSPRVRALASAHGKPSPLSGIGEESSSRIRASPSCRNLPAAIGISAMAMSRNTTAGRAVLASDKVERHGIRMLRW